VCYFTSDKSFNTVTANFNFAQNQVYSSSSDTKAAMGLEKYKGGFIDFDETGLNFYKDKIIRLEQYKTSSTETRGSSSFSLYNSGDFLISFFDEKMQPIKQISIPQYFPTYTSMGKEPGYKVINNKLIIFTNVCEEKKITLKSRYKFRYIIIDLDKMETVKDEMVDVNNRYNSIVNASNTVWIDNAALIFHLIDTNAFSQKDFAVKIEKLQFDF